MAKTIYFNDGTHEVIFNDKKTAFARILRERLGPDVESMFARFMSDALDSAQLLEKLDKQDKQIATLESDKDDLQDKINELDKLQYDAYSEISNIASTLHDLIYNNPNLQDSLEDIQTSLDQVTELLRTS